MTVYKLTVNLDATLAVQNPNGSFHYFKPSIGAEFTTDETDDLTVLNKKFEDQYAEVIGPNFSSVVNQLLVSSEDTETTDDEVDSGCNCDTADSCACKPLVIVEKPEEIIVIGDAGPLLLAGTDLLKEEWE